VKAIVVRQPWATLITLGVKSIETRPSPPSGPMRPEGVRGLPGCSLERGERIAIVAGAAKPAMRSTDDESDDGSGWWFGDDLRVCVPDDDDHWWLERWPGLRSTEEMETWPLPLGAVVCTVTVDDALPVIDGPTGAPWPDVSPGDPAIARYRTEMDWVSWHPDDLEVRGWARHFNADRSRCFPLDDQLPLGDFTPGRWGWLLSDVRRTTPIPCKGRQGVFTLPDDVAAQIEAQS
jgi:hypothetical protein